ncbi:replication protein a-related [Anaeramoeba flamelloides]|uniref:Replication protein a-related n=1 Tax=Anaeramoeba flamelloides TaxID=1746091 RepID=A0ABQ8YJA5_9EUKA|nr:replication protein a-related [Anaeramoeba flamelloides]
MFTPIPLPLFYESPNKIQNLKYNLCEDIEWEWNKKQNLRSVTLKQIDKCSFSKNDQYLLDGFIVERVLIVANITSIDIKTTYASYTISDGTSSFVAIDCKKNRLQELNILQKEKPNNHKKSLFLENNCVCKKKQQKKKKNEIKGNKIFKIYAEIQNYFDEKKLFIEDITEIWNHNEVTLHFLQVIQQHLFFKDNLRAQSIKKSSLPGVKKNTHFNDIDTLQWDFEPLRTPQKKRTKILELRRNNDNIIPSKMPMLKRKKKFQIINNNTRPKFHIQFEYQFIKTNNATNAPTNNNLATNNKHKINKNYYTISNDHFLQNLIICALINLNDKKGLMIEEIAKELQSDPLTIKHTLQLLHQKNEVYFETYTNLWKVFY